ncbi:hypothetical protein V2J09_021314, partial [Rumex salicifolius]
HPSANTPPDGLPPPPISSSAIAGARINTANHHGNTPESSNNGRSNSSLTGLGESKPSSSSSSPPKSQDFSSVSFSNQSPNDGNSIPAQAQPQQQPPPQAHEGRGGENPSQSGDMFLQWGQRKRSKRSVGDKFSGVRTMPPLPPPTGKGGGGCGGTKLRTSSNGVFSSKDLRNRNLEDTTRMGGGGGGGSGGSPPSKNQEGVSRPISSRSTVGKRSDKSDAKKPSSFGGSIRKEKPTESLAHHQPSDHHHHHHLTSPARGAAAAEAETHNGKGGGEVVEWPRIYIALSRKEKEDDFFSMKGTKLPHRPKKRAKAIDRTLQYCFPGMWLSDLSRARYEVRERKSVKKPRRRGLKGLDSMESDSE